MVHLRNHAIALLGIWSLAACAVLGAQVNILKGASDDATNEGLSTFGNGRQIDSGSPDGGHDPALTKADIDGWMKELSNWGRWGADDQLGTMNLITAAKRIKAARMVKAGIAVSLAHNSSTEIAVDNNHPLIHEMLTTGATPNEIFAMDQYTEAFHGLGMTHLDALTHMFYGDKMYNGFSRQTVTAAGAEKLSVIELKGGIFTRGILFDIPRLKGKLYLEPGEKIYPKDLDRWAKQAGITVEPGDFVMIRTGRWDRRQKLGPWNVGKLSAGLDPSCARWLHDHDVSVLGSDVESDVLPSGVEGVLMPIHLLSLAAMACRSWITWISSRRHRLLRSNIAGPSW